MKKNPAHLGLIAVITLLLSLLFWWLVPTGRTPTPTASAPFQTRRAQQFRKKHNPPPVSPVSNPSDMHSSKRVRLIIKVHASIPERYPLSMGWSVGPEDYLPMEDEAPWPEIPSAQAIQQLAEDLRNNERNPSASLKNFLEHARTDGLLEPVQSPIENTPWRQVLSMYAHFAEEVIDAPLFSKYDLEHFHQTRQTAQAIIAQYPDEPVAEYARLLELEILRNARLGDKDHEYAEQTLLHILEHTDDEMVLEATAAVLSDEQFLTHSPALQQWTESHIDSLPQHAAEVLAVQQITVQTQSENSKATQFWIQKYRELLDERCLSEPQCTEEFQHLNTHEGTLAAHWDIPPNTWRGALTVLMLHCHKKTPFALPLTTSVTWDGESWSPHPDVERCFTRKTIELNPITPVEVDMELVHQP